ncbi:methyltransferase type 11 [Thiocapsa imhoffii]|uniref:Methyltransferase type 11 n=1 Tax=Thiocapsa imhoffii TaxID=382777 RepID=A0A9X0WFV7_9GAMM|nr:class I SAM-dependent methyltransferase [Thiocapsa imhoffii]MBK1643838.1 methyltransferase type 11 [Thiocapsa imhoffii]
MTTPEASKLLDVAQIQAAYSAFAQHYDAQRASFDMQDVLEGLLRRVPARGRLLDLGCGAGEPVARTFIERHWEVTGVDFCEAMLALAQREVPAMHRVCCDLREARFPSASFDAITAVYSLFHIPSAEHPALFARMREWLRPDGVALFTYATRDYTGADRFDGYLDFMGQSLFYSHVSVPELMRELASAGLTVEEAVDRDIGGETFLWVSVRRTD